MRTQDIGTIHRNKSIWGKWNTKLQWSAFVKWHCFHAFLREDDYGRAICWNQGSFSVILENSGPLKGTWWASVKMSGLCLVTEFVLEPPVFSLLNYPPNVERPHLGHSDFLLLSQRLKAEYRLWVPQGRNMLKGFSWLLEGLKAAPGVCEFILKVYTSLWTFGSVLSPHQGS